MTTDTIVTVVVIGILAAWITFVIRYWSKFMEWLEYEAPD
jgi:hypothetical protein